MHRFHLAPNDWVSAALTGSEAHHARNVLRLQPGDRVILFDGHGREATAEITALDSRAVRLRFLQEAVTPPLRARITLAQAIPKGKNMDLIVQKAVEIGAAEIFPLLSARTVVQLDPRARRKSRRNGRPSHSRRPSSAGRTGFPRFMCPPRPRILRRRAAQDLLRPATHRLAPAGRAHLKKILADYAQAHDGARPANVLMLIGPEGDFTPAEIALARSHGCAPLTLGPIILRVETAAIYCLSILSYELLAEN